MLFDEDYRGPLSAGANAFQGWSFEEFERRAKGVLGPRWTTHCAGLFGLGMSSVHQYKYGNKGRSVPRRVCFVIALLEELDRTGGEIPLEFCDYEMPQRGRPRKDDDAGDNDDA
jgi:hypothetical protein